MPEQITFLSFFCRIFLKVKKSCYLFVRNLSTELDCSVLFEMLLIKLKYFTQQLISCFEKKIPQRQSLGKTFFVHFPFRKAMNYCDMYVVAEQQK